MRIRIFLVCLAVLFLHGCATAPKKPQQPSQPQNVYHVVGKGQTLYTIAKTYGVDLNALMSANNITDPRQMGVGDRLVIPGATRQMYVQPTCSLSAGTVEQLVGPAQHTIAWHTITVHHSGTRKGDAACFDRDHRRRGMGGLFYHFVIGNGTGSRDGEIEVGWRWRRQAQVNRKQDIQICLVGNFNAQQVSAAQFEALTKLIKVLMQQYSIPATSVRMHKDAPSKATACPGRNFPISRLISAIQS